MKTRNKILVGLTFSSIALFFACSGDDKNIMEPDPKPIPPSFSISSVNQQFADGSDGILFFAKPDKNISIIRVDITTPVNQKNTVNVGGQVFLKDDVIAMQDQNFLYFRVSGNWTFRFVGNVEPSKEGFDVTENLNVGATPTP